MRLANYLKKISMYLQLFTSNQHKKATIYSRYLGIKIGKKVRITHFPRWGSEPYLIEIGDNVTITRGVCFFTHDGGVGLFRDEYPGINVFGRIIVGNNVFIGANAIILPNVKIGNNVVIGAGSVVTKDIPNNVVVAGVPARILRTIYEYKEDSLKKAVYIESKDAKKRKQEIISKFDSLS